MSASQNVTNIVHLQQAAPINGFGPPPKPPECRVQHQINSNSLISEPPTCEAACAA